MCRECGIIVGPEASSPPAVAALATETASRRPPVTGNINMVSASVLPNDACSQEWHVHIAPLRDQPKEVLDGAFAVFEQVFQQQPLTGTKARALALVSLLWASRRLHGNNSCNEKYLLSALQTPTRMMNKAFSTLASVIRPCSDPCPDKTLPHTHTYVWTCLKRSCEDSPMLLGSEKKAV